jgi:hypothetical protein
MVSTDGFLESEVKQLLQMINSICKRFDLKVTDLPEKDESPQKISGSEAKCGNKRPS